MNESILNRLVENFGDSVALNVSLSDFSNWKVGGLAAAVIAPKSIEELKKVIEFLRLHGIGRVVVGNTTNLLFSDEGVNAVLIQIAHNISGVRVDGDFLIAAAGTYVPLMARAALQYGLAGVEHTIGIPGTLGGLIYMNGGSLRKSIGDNVEYVKAMDSEGEIVTLQNADCRFAYRRSVFQSSDYIILEVGLKLEKVIDRRAMRQNMLSILRERAKKFPRRIPSCGSVFVSDPQMYNEVGPPGYVIESCGLKGQRKGGGQISEKHANFIVNNGNANASDILYLINLARDSVKREKGYLMNVEAKVVTVNGEIKEI